MPVIFRVVIAILPAISAAALAQEGPGARRLYEQFSPAVAEVRVVEKRSGAKHSVGTGFHVGEQGEIATNYHVISPLVLDPDRYHARLVREGQPDLPLSLLAFDVVSDLAVLKAEGPAALALKLHGGAVAKGERIFALGNPYDLGMSIVEGTYNGRLEHARIERIHFSGALNPGMSGGPALLATGEVIGVNVASASNSVSFLVPVERLQALLERARQGPPASGEEALRAELRDQLWQHQERYAKDLFAGEVGTVPLGSYQVPSAPMKFFNCWGDAPRKDEKQRHELALHQCSTDDQIFLSEEQEFTPMWFRHRELHTTELSASGFYALYSQFFESSVSELDGNDELFTPFRCRVRFVGTAAAAVTFKTAFCARAYRKLDGLYDVVFKAAAVGRRDSGLETVLVLSALSFANAERLSRRYLEEITWTE
jgi:hypothetical protein